MMSKAIDQRQSARITTVPHANAEGTPGHPLLVNVSQSGACLWLSEPPPALQYLVLRFQCKGRERILKTRIMWARLCSAMSYQKKLPFSRGWLAGIAFDRDSTDTRIADIPHDILHAGHARVSFQDEDDDPTSPKLKQRKSNI